MLLGNLNDIVSTDKMIGRTQKTPKYTSLREIVNKCQLIDIGFSGQAMTWSNRRKGKANVKQ